ncbi:MAG TPA: protein kinase, partial [Vicinamibacterales bacterium]|nr:protein kinase [Vicinamibacterales bacterium]
LHETMPIVAGTLVGPYEIVGLLGAGGMGEVYRARDTKLAREVALKMLPESFVSDADRVSRFQREAQVLASLNHPNIAAIYGLEESSSGRSSDPPTRALVLELVEGPTLADRLALEPLALEEALSIARQMAEALEAAHAHGVIHRDLKPANVKVRPDGLVKVLDFGLAKILEASGANEASSVMGLSLSPTMTSPAMTRMGLIMGTAAYMSPEQARGSLVDSRTDVWSFGVVLYEMLAGKTLFEGPTVSDTLAAVLRADLDWDRLPSNLPPDVQRLLRRCLQRDPKKRLQHIGDARVEIEDLQAGPVRESPETPTGKRWGLAAAAALLTALVVAPAVWTLKPLPAASVLATSFVIRTPSEAPVGRNSPLALSPDGQQLVYTVGLGSDFVSRLFHQSLNAFDPRSLEGTDASSPFFSPDGSAVGFFSRSSNQLQQLRLAGGGATRLVSAANSVGASWGDDETIVFAEDWGLPLRVTQLGTSATRDLTRLNVSAGERAHLWPQLLPSNRAVLFTVWTAAPTWDESLLAVADLETGMHRIVLRGGAFGRYSSSGHLVFWRDNALMAVPFDLSRLAVSGDPVKVVSGVRLDNSNGGAHFALSSTGTLAYVAGGVDTFAEGFLADRSGRQVVRLDEMVPVGDPAFSPDGKRVALTLYKGGTFGIGVYDLERHLLTPLPLAGDNLRPSWTMKGDRVTFVSNASGAYNYHSMPFDGSGAPEALFTPEQAAQGGLLASAVWSPDGRQLLYGKSGGKTGADIWIHTPGQKAAPKALIATGATESNPAFSPDGRFIVYQSDESGTVEVYVRPFPNVDASRELISRSGGTRPTWSREGTEIFYLSGKGMMRVPVTYGRGDASRPSFGQPSEALAMSGLSSFDVSPDGRMFAIERVPIEKAATEIRVVVNWFEELRRLVPAR